jgi:hypothetical protein
VVSSLPFVFFFFCFTTLVLFFFTAPRDLGILARVCTRVSWRSALFPRLALGAEKGCSAGRCAAAAKRAGGSRLHEAAPRQEVVSGQVAQLMPQRSGGGGMYTTSSSLPAYLRTCSAN